MSKPNNPKTKKQPAPTSKPLINKDSKGLSLSQYINGKEIYWITGIVGLLAFFVLKDFLFLNKTTLYKDIGSDTINAYYPTLVQLSEMWRNGIPQWSFSQGMGQNLYSFLGWDVFTWFLFFFSKDGIIYALTCMHFFKIIIAGIIFYYYLKTLSLSKYVSLMGAVLFAFCAYMTIGVCWFTYSTEAIYFAFLLLAFEKFFKQNVWYLFPIAIAIIAASSPFSVYLSSLFLFFYAIIRSIEDERNVKKIFLLFFKMAGLGLIGLALSSVFFFSQVLQIVESPRGSGEVSYAGTLSSYPMFSHTSFIQAVSFIFRIFSTDLLGTGNNFKGWSNYLESPLIYSGLVSLLLVPQIFFFLNKKRKILYSACIILFTIPVAFPFFRYMFFLFQGDYFRTLSLFMCIGILFLSLQALDFIIRESRINIKLLITTFIILIAILYYPYFDQASPVDTELRNIVTFFLFVDTIIIYLISTPKSRLVGQIALLVFVSVEVVYFSSITVGKRDVITHAELQRKAGYNDYTIDAVAYLNSIDHSFYRINKYFSSGPAMHGSLNDAGVQGFKGTGSYLSFNQLNYIHFLQDLKVIDKKDEQASRWAPGLASRLFLQTLASCKYSLTRENKVPLAGMGYDSITTLGDISVFRNKFNLPLGFTYDTYIPSKEFSGLSNTQMDISLFKAFVINEEQKVKFKDFIIFDLRDTAGNFTFDDYAKYTNGLKKDTLQIKEYGNNLIKGTIQLSKKKLLFFSIPFDEGWSAIVDGKKATLEMVNIGFMGLVMDKGKHTVALTYNAPFKNEGAITSSVSICLFGFFAWFSRRKKSKIRSQQKDN